MTPYQYTYQNPVRYIDPTGMAADEPYDWIKNKLTGKYEWRNEVTKESETPEGYKYIGKENNDILKDLGWNVTYPALKSKRWGI